MSPINAAVLQVEFVKPIDHFEAIGTRYFNIQHRPHCPCVASLKPDGAVMTAWRYGDRLVGFRTVFVTMLIHPHVVALTSEDGAFLDGQAVKSLALHGISVVKRRNARFVMEENFRPHLSCEFLAYMIPHDHQQVLSTAVKSDPPEAVDHSGVPVGVARFMMALGAVHSGSAVDVQVDTREFARACRRADVLAEYAGLVPGGNEDTPRRTCDRDEAAAIRLGLARKEIMDGDLYVWPTTDASVCHDPAMRDDPKTT